MVHASQKIIYRDEVCTVVEIVQNYKNDEDYYVLSYTHDPSLIVRVSVKMASKFIRQLVTGDEIDALVQKIPTIDVIPIDNWNRGIEYKELLSDGSHESLVRIIKTAYARQQAKAERKQRPNENDKHYFRQAEHLLYNEIAAVMDISYDDAKEYITQQVLSITSANATL
ncbi:hypothetical protein EOL96_02420 [Candidatus Saccharibacteria bacterium]|nr:hypothetical protein [Candidatus Saccharibacteria bacterium]